MRMRICIPYTRVLCQHWVVLFWLRGGRAGRGGPAVARAAAESPPVLAVTGPGPVTRDRPRTGRVSLMLVFR